MSAFPMPDARYEGLLDSKNIVGEKRGDYLKWVRFYLHFCSKYGHVASEARSLPPFLGYWSQTLSLVFSLAKIRDYPNGAIYCNCI